MIISISTHPNAKTSLFIETSFSSTYFETPPGATTCPPSLVSNIAVENRSANLTTLSQSKYTFEHLR